MIALHLESLRTSAHSRRPARGNTLTVVRRTSNFAGSSLSIWPAGSVAQQLHVAWDGADVTDEGKDVAKWQGYRKAGPLLISTEDA